MDIKQTLMEIGLTRGEIDVYLALLEVGTTSTGGIIKKAHVSSSKVYEVLQRLLNKGLASFIVDGGVKKYSALPPDRLIEFLEEKKNKLTKAQDLVSEILPQLQKKQKEEPKASLYRGMKGIQELLNLLIDSGGKEYISYGSMQDESDSKKIFIEKLHKTRVKKGIKARILLPHSLEKLGKKLESFGKTNVRLTETGFKELTETAICGNKVAIIMWLEEPHGFLIEEETAAQSYMHFFDKLWEIAGSPVRILYGREGPLIALNETFAEGEKGTELFGYGTDEDDYHIQYPKELAEYTSKMKEYSVNWKLLFGKGFKAQDKYSEKRYLPRGLTAPVRTLIYGNKVAIVDFTKPFTTIIIDKKSVADAYKKQFKHLWNMAKK